MKDECQNEEYNNTNLEIIVSRIDKTQSKSLGITLEGTVDIDDQGNETYPHHYIRSVMQKGPVDNALDAKFRIGDELLEIDFVTLYAINYIELLDILKALKNKIIYMVCARKTLIPADTKMSKRAKSEGFLVEAAANLEQLEKAEEVHPFYLIFLISFLFSSTTLTDSMLEFFL